MVRRVLRLRQCGAFPRHFRYVDFPVVKIYRTHLWRWRQRTGSLRRRGCAGFLSSVPGFFPARRWRARGPKRRQRRPRLWHPAHRQPPRRGHPPRPLKPQKSGSIATRREPPGPYCSPGSMSSSCRFVRSAAISASPGKGRTKRSDRARQGTLAPWVAAATQGHPRAAIPARLIVLSPASTSAMRLTSAHSASSLAPSAKAAIRLRVSKAFCLFSFMCVFPVRLVPWQGEYPRVAGRR